MTCKTDVVVQDVTSKARGAIGEIVAARRFRASIQCSGWQGPVATYSCWFTLIHFWDPTKPARQQTA